MIASAERTLSEWASALLGARLRWGETDCGSLAMAALRVLGRPGPAVAPYASRQQALEAWRAAKDRLGGTEVAPCYLQAGDVAWRPRGALPACAVFLGRRVLTATARHGVVVVRLEALLEQPGVIFLRFAHV